MAKAALNVAHGYELPFRLYGAVIGAKISGIKELEEKADMILEEMKKHEQESPIGSPHSTINKVMFATALDPGVLRKREPYLHITE